MTRVPFPAGAQILPLRLHLQTGCGAVQATYPKGDRGFFPRGKTAGV